MLIKSSALSQQTNEIDADSLDKLFSNINDKDEQLRKFKSVTFLIDTFLVIEAKLIK